jgi:hypothetical protein
MQSAKARKRQSRLDPELEARLKDLADVLEVVRILKLPAELAEELHPWVREKYRELWRAAQVEDRE